MLGALLGEGVALGPCYAIVQEYKREVNVVQVALWPPTCPGVT